MFVDTYGRRSRTEDIKWSRLPLSFGKYTLSSRCFMLRPYFDIFLNVSSLLRCSLQRALPVRHLLQLPGRHRGSGTRFSGVRRSSYRGHVLLKNVHFDFFLAVFPTSLSVLPDLLFWPTWTSPTLATWARPSPLGPFTWPRPTRTNCGSSAVKEV